MRPEIRIARPAHPRKYQQIPTGTLLELIRYENDDRAFEELFHRYYTLLCQRVRGMIDCPHRTEEIVSDVFIKMWNNRHKLAISSSLKAYLFTAVRNQAIDFLRKQARNRTIDGRRDHLRGGQRRCRGRYRFASPPGAAHLPAQPR